VTDPENPSDQPPGSPERSEIEALRAQIEYFESVNSRLEDQIQTLLGRLATSEVLAKTDPLTGTLNRRGIIEIYEDQLRPDKHRRDSDVISAHSALFIDLDHLKQINTTLGHDGADTVLKSVAEKIQESTRGEDSVGRVGGDEFVVLMPRTEKEVAQIVAKRIQEAVGGITTFQDRGVVPSVTIGVDEIMPELDFGAALKRADLALLEAKNRDERGSIVVVKN
jgi:diguanylate cyclase (GGDEF)-like protein